MASSTSSSRQNSKDILRLKFKKPESWNWEISTDKSVECIEFPRILLYDNVGNLLADIQEANCVKSNKSAKSINEVKNIKRSKSKSVVQKRERESDKSKKSIERTVSELSKNISNYCDMDISKSTSDEDNFPMKSISEESEIPVYIYSAKGLIRRNFKDKEFDEIRDKQKQFDASPNKIAETTTVTGCNRCYNIDKFEDVSVDEFKKTNKNHEIENNGMKIIEEFLGRGNDDYNTLKIDQSDMDDESVYHVSEKSTSNLSSNENIRRSKMHNKNSVRNVETCENDFLISSDNCSICSWPSSVNDNNNGGIHSGIYFVENEENYRKMVLEPLNYKNGSKNSNWRKTSFDVDGSEFEIILKKRRGTLGFTLQRENKEASGHWVHTLVHRPALTDGRIKPGDKIISANNVQLDTMSHDEAIAFLRQIGDLVKLRLYRKNEPKQGMLMKHSSSENTKNPFHNKTYLRPEALNFLHEISQRRRK